MLYILNTWMDFICLKCSAKVLPPPTNLICHENKICLVVSCDAATNNGGKKSVLGI